MPLEEASPGDGSGVGGLWGTGAPCFLAWTQPLPRGTAGKVPALSSGPSFTICTPGALPHQRLRGP